MSSGKASAGVKDDGKNGGNDPIETKPGK